MLPALRYCAARWPGLFHLQRSLSCTVQQHGYTCISAQNSCQPQQQPMCMSQPAATQSNAATATTVSPANTTASLKLRHPCMPMSTCACMGSGHSILGLVGMQQYSSHMLRYSSNASGPPLDGTPPGDDNLEAAGKELRMSLQEALMKLVDAAVEMVEAGRTDDAISVLKEGIATFEPNFPDSPELGELHNQVALLSLVDGNIESAAIHATTALAITRKHFSGDGPLVGHRQLRLGVATFAQGALTEAAGLLHSALEALTTAGDASRHEASFYLGLSLLAGTRDVAQVAQVEERLLSDLKEIKTVFGAESMITSLALAQHDRVAHQPLAAAEPDNMLCEALLKQHAKLLESVDPNSEDLAVAQYKLATFYYAHDMLSDAQGYVRRAGGALRARLPDEHDLVAMCKHRLGMICAVLGDHRAALQLLQASLDRYSGGQDGEQGAGAAMSGLAREAQLGLAIAQYRALPSSAPNPAKQESLLAVRGRLDELAAAIGVNHMLVRGAMRHVAKMNVSAFA